MDKDFYDSSFWNEVEGVKTWQTRLLYNLIYYVMFEGNDVPFVTDDYSEYTTDSKYLTCLASWHYQGDPKRIFEIEIEGKLVTLFYIEKGNDKTFYREYGSSKFTNETQPYNEIFAGLNEFKQLMVDNLIPNEHNNVSNEIIVLTNHLINDSFDTSNNIETF